MSDIKVGDWVRRRKQHIYGSKAFAADNGPFRVVRTYRSGFDDCIELDRGPHESPADGWHARYFEVVEKAEEKGEYIIILKQHGKLAPAGTPRTYATEAQAKAVAASMAEKHAGQEFLIFKAVGKAKTTAAVVEMF